MHHIRTIGASLLPMPPIVVHTDHPDIKRHSAILLTRQRILRFRAFASLEQLPGTAVLPPNDDGHLDRYVTRLKPPDDRDTEKASIQIQAANPHPKTGCPVKQPG
jgi:hypothetical protein